MTARERVRTGEGFRVTVTDKVLVHLRDYVRLAEAAEVPADLTQSGIAEVVGARRSHVSATLSALRTRGLVEERTVRVTDQFRRRKAYFLTPKGLERADDLAEAFRGRTVRVPVDDETREVPIRDLPEALGEPYYLVDILCCVRRDGSLDLERLTGQPEKPPEPPAVPPPARRAVVACPNCRVGLEIPSDAEGSVVVVCGSCGVTFHAAVGVPVRTAVAELPSVPTMRKVNRGLGVTFLAFAAGFAVTASLMLLTAAALVGCGLILPAFILGILSLPALRGHSAFGIALLGVVLLTVAPALLFVGSLAGAALTVGAGAAYASALTAAATESPRRRLTVGGSFAVAAGLAPIVGSLGFLVGPGLLIAAAALLATVIPPSGSEPRDRDAVVAAGLAAAIGGITYVRWSFVAEWDLVALGTLALVVGSVYGFVVLAMPLSAKTRSEAAAALGTFLVAMAGFIVVSPAATGWPADFAPYFLVFGVGAVYLATRIHRPESLWPLVCLGAGAFVVTASVVTYLTLRTSLSAFAIAALAAWTLAGAAAMWTPFSGTRGPAHLLALRAGILSAFGGVLLVAGAQMLYAGRGVEGIVELTLGAPLVGFALLRSGAPWLPRLAVSGLFLTTVLASWLALVLL